jgi:hypothetical protein
VIVCSERGLVPIAHTGNFPALIDKPRFTGTIPEALVLLLVVSLLKSDSDATGQYKYPEYHF